MQQILERAAREMPDRPAFRFLEQELSFAELDALSTKLSNCLSDQGVAPGDRVAIYLNKSLECAVAVYGILKAGAAYVPLDPGAPLSRLGMIIEECGIRWMVSHEARSADVSSLLEECNAGLEGVVGCSANADGRVRQVSWEDIRGRQPEALDYRGRTAQDTAYIMYTSGSTGVPKGIVHSHGSGLSYALMAAALYELRPEDRLSNLPPLHFDQSIFDYFSGAAAGACTVIISEAHGKLPASLSKLIEQEALTVWYSVPFALIQLLLHGALDQRDLRSLRCIMFGGEVFPARYLSRLKERLPDARFCNVYGPAEVNQCTSHFLSRRPVEGDATVPIGAECPNVETLVVDEQDQPVEDGEQGELLVRTPTMMRGYFNRPDLNRRAFYRRDNGDDTVDVFYRTGDLALRNAAGELVFLGRKDRQVKLRGYRVELDEVEAVFGRHPEVKQAAAFLKAASTPEASLELAVCLHDTGGCSETQLRTFAAQSLPGYAMPAAISVLDDFPRTGTGKVDRNKLRELSERGRPDPQTGSQIAGQAKT